MAIKIKNSTQINGIRESCHLAAKTLQYISPFVKAGITTRHLDNLIHDYILKHGAKPAPLNYKGFPKSSCISINEVVCHGIPSLQKLKDGDILNIDITTILNSYFGDTSKMFTVGKITPEAQKLIEVTQKCLDLGIEECYPGNKLGNIGHVIFEYATNNGYGVVYEFCGHGVGLKFHEEPEVSFVSEQNTGPVLKPGMIFTIEPMINEGKARCIIDKKDGWTARTIDGKLSAQFEHTILITDTGCEVLTDIENKYDHLSKKKTIVI